LWEMPSELESTADFTKERLIVIIDQSEWSLYLGLVILSREGCQEVQEVSRFVGLFWLG
jgi:hypothetical protein